MGWLQSASKMMREISTRLISTMKTTIQKTNQKTTKKIERIENG